MSTLPMIGLLLVSMLAAADSSRPNILWISCEDISPNLGCYGDPVAVTPNLDRLAGQGVRYTHAFAPIGVCAPARSCIITGMYPPSLGSQHMRCQGRLPEGVKLFPAYLRDAGYYCTNNSKTDYNLPIPKGTWDENSNKAHWKNRGNDQPFFAVFNITICHESQVRTPDAQHARRTADFTDKERRDPAKVPVPPYHPDEPEVHADWAQYHEVITLMDREVGQYLKELDDAGLAEDTIVIYWSDHGAGLPRSKRWLYDSSTRVPLIVRMPAKWQSLAPGAAGTATDRLVSFVDFAPTMLSLAGCEIPGHMQGYAFLGAGDQKRRDFVHGYRDRMDERYDMIRSVRDSRFKYIRNYMPQLPWFHEQYISYMYEMPTMQVWQRLADEGKLTGPRATFMAKHKPYEELYDTEADPFEINNLAGDPQYRQQLDRLRNEMQRWQLDIRDLGMLSETMLREWQKSGAPYDLIRGVKKTEVDYKQLLDVAGVCAAIPAGDPTKPQFPWGATAMAFASNEEMWTNPYYQWWQAQACWAMVRFGHTSGVEDSFADALNGVLKEQPLRMETKVVLAEALCDLGKVGTGLEILAAGLRDPAMETRLWAANALDRLNEKARPVLPAMRERLSAGDDNYVERVLSKAVADLDEATAQK